MADPVTPQKAPYFVDVTEGKTYYWCACGRSKSQPFCDGSHKDAPGFAPVEYVARKSRSVSFCGCKHTNRRPICDGSHSRL